MFKKSDLKTGMFGKMSDGDMFVIVDDLIVYNGHQGFDRIGDVRDDLCLPYYSIDYLIKANSFCEAECAIEHHENIIWERNPPKKIPTMLEVFLERNPNAPLDEEHDVPKMCPSEIDSTWSDIKDDCYMCDCRDCWNRPVPNTKEVV